MMRPSVRTSLRLSLVLLAASIPVATASAQRAVATTDSLAVAQGDSVRPSGGNWLVALLKKTARRSDDSSATDLAADGTTPAYLAPTTSRVFNSRKDSLAYE